jgi:hypothetical protein
MSYICLNPLSQVMGQTHCQVKTNISSLIINMALKLHILISSSAAIQQVISNSGVVQTNLCHQLTLKNAAKPVMGNFVEN